MGEEYQLSTWDPTLTCSPVSTPVREAPYPETLFSCGKDEGQWTKINGRRSMADWLSVGRRLHYYTSNFKNKQTTLPDSVVTSNKSSPLEGWLTMNFVERNALSTAQLYSTERIPTYQDCGRYRHLGPTETHTRPRPRGFHQGQG